MEAWGLHAHAQIGVLLPLRAEGFYVSQPRRAMTHVSLLAVGDTGDPGLRLSH